MNCEKGGECIDMNMIQNGRYEKESMKKYELKGERKYLNLSTLMYDFIESC